MTLRRLIRPNELLCVPGVFDGMSVRIASKVGAPALYMTGYGTVASHLGLPDAGLASYGDMVERVRVLSSLAGEVPLIADGDTGYGGLLNVAHATRGYEAAGAAAIQLEDQEFPKKCGHTPSRKVVSREAAAAKIRVAVDARASDDFLIIARTDARTNYGLDEALRRGEAFAEAGADVLFIEAPETEADMERIGDAFGGDVPLLVNVVEGGKTPVLPRQRYVDLGYQIAIFPATAFLAAGKAIEAAYAAIRDTGSSAPVTDDLADFMAFSKTMGFDDIWAFERKYAHLEAPPTTSKDASEVTRRRQSNAPPPPPPQNAASSRAILA
eukprot:CAMPEP_0118902364 /NCGR_PEP_ID=MMETSP1166-20130328/7685_1 /TAXON_ID=1104430 /ORGANISM="Chrysoreinhardia sp, Strain CCMP3193" /LENGTH=325 /DNA_ID=CAMNT_0006841569 /DNA_START=29 /DNA_END=1003 /DNA_ORIENTATION=-